MDLTPIIQALLQQLGSTLVGLLSEDLIYTVLGALVATQAVKLGLTYTWRLPAAPAIWFLWSPLATSPVAWAAWSFNERVPWWVVALVASLLSNLLYSILLKRLLGKYAPDVYAQLNFPVDRRRADAGPPAGAHDRRRPAPPPESGAP